MWRQSSASDYQALPGRPAVTGLAIVIVGVFIVLPLLPLLAGLVQRPDALAAVWLDSRQRGLLWNTAALGLGTAAAAALIGTPLGLALARVSLPAKNGLRLALASPALFPPYVAALAWTYVGGPVSGLPGAILVLALLLYPLTMLASEVAFRSIDGRQEEAGLVSADPRLVFRRITLPLAGPTVAAAALVTFVLAIADFAVPSLLGVKVYTTEVFTAFAALYDVDRATTLSAPLLLLCGCITILTAPLIVRTVASARSHGIAGVVVPLGRMSATIAALLVIGLALLLPLVLLALEASRVSSWGALSGKGTAAAIWNSLRLSAAGATLVVLLAVPVGYAVARARRIGLAAAVLLSALGVPATVIGVGLIAIWNRPGPLGLPYGTEAIPLLGYVARLLPIGGLLVAASVRQVSLTQEAAAMIGGAGWIRTLLRIVLPQIRGPLAAVWLMTFVLAFGELGVALLVAPPGESTLPVRVYTLIANAPPSTVAGLALLQSVVVLVPLTLLGVLAELRERR